MKISREIVVNLAWRLASGLRAMPLLVPGILLFASGCGRTPQTGNSDPAPAGNPLPVAAGGASAAPSAPLRVSDVDVNVFTYHHNNGRTGEYLSETVLTPANVNSNDFGKIGFLRVRGLVDAQPLYVANLTIKGAPHKVVFVATEHDLVYAFDAPLSGKPPCWARVKRPATIEGASR
jgi:hypothetical protein